MRPGIRRAEAGLAEATENERGNEVRKQCNQEMFEHEPVFG
jgi:hypothetical protein